MGRLTRTGQDAPSAERNSAFFAGNRAYAESITELDTYRNIRGAVNAEISGARRLLDVGNGGVFDYDVGLASEVVGVDLFLDGTPAGLPNHVTLRRGDALALDEPDDAYDRVVEISVLHHLVGPDVDSTLDNIRRALMEARRVLSPGGRLVVMESCLDSRAFFVERRLFRSLQVLARTRVLSHPAVLQFPPEAISAAIAERFEHVQTRPIPVGRWILQFGHRWPSALTPARPYLFVAVR